MSMVMLVAENIKIVMKKNDFEALQSATIIYRNGTIHFVNENEPNICVTQPDVMVETNLKRWSIRLSSMEVFNGDIPEIDTVVGYATVSGV